MPRIGHKKPVEVVVTETGCRVCTSHALRSGYPVIVVDGRVVTMHRHLYATRVGPIPEGQVVRHTCDNRRCVNTDHMVLGTQLDNIADMVARNRSAYGERNGLAKLTADAVRYIRGSAETNVALARRFNVSRKAIWQVRHGLSWKRTK